MGECCMTLGCHAVSLLGGSRQAVSLGPSAAEISQTSSAPVQMLPGAQTIQLFQKGTIFSYRSIRVFIANGVMEGAGQPREEELGGRPVHLKDLLSEGGQKGQPWANSRDHWWPKGWDLSQGDLPDEEMGWRGWELAKPCRYLQGRWWHPDVEPYCVQALPRLPGLPQGQQRASVCTRVCMRLCECTSVKVSIHVYVRVCKCECVCE